MNGLLDCLEAALTRSDLAAAYRVVNDLCGDREVADLLPGDQLARFWLRALEAAAYSGDTGTALQAERMAATAIAALPSAGEPQARAGFALQVLRSESARLSGDLGWMSSATERTMRAAIANVHERTDFERYQAGWEVVELMSAAGLRADAFRLAGRLHDFASARLTEVDAIESAILRHMMGTDFEAILAQRLAVALPRLDALSAPPSRAARAPRGSGMVVDELEGLARRARAHGRPGWALKAEQCAHATSIMEGGNVQPLLEAARELQAFSRVCGLPHTEQANRLLAQWCELALVQPRDTHSPPAPREHPLVSNGILQQKERYFQACQAARQGHHEVALSSYADYVGGCVSARPLSLAGTALTLNAMAELLLALPKWRPARPAFPPDAIHIACVTIEHSRSPDVAGSVSALARRQNLSVRRLQQSFKALDLPSPKHLLA